MRAPLPRKDNLAVQFFASLVGEAGEGGCVIYAEALLEESRALGLLGTWLVDAGSRRPSSRTLERC